MIAWFAILFIFVHLFFAFQRFKTICVCQKLLLIFNSCILFLNFWSFLVILTIKNLHFFNRLWLENGSLFFFIKFRFFLSYLFFRSDLFLRNCLFFDGFWTYNMGRTLWCWLGMLKTLLMMSIFEFNEIILALNFRWKRQIFWQ